MCDFTNGIKFCTCEKNEIKFRYGESYKKVKGELVKINDKRNDGIPLIYIWRLYRYMGKKKDFLELGRYMLPKNDIGNGLNAEWIALNLNVENCFDFDYVPIEGDNLFIQTNEILAPYISFIYKNKEWICDHYDPFSEYTEHIQDGKLDVPNVKNT